MNKTIEVYAVSSIGNSRSNQEDNGLWLSGGGTSPDVLNRPGGGTSTARFARNVRTDRFLAAVSDGMGGHACGEVASYLTVKYLAEHADALWESARGGAQALADGLSPLNRAVSQAALEDRSRKGMGATLCGVIGIGDGLYGFFAGDSRLYQFSEGRLTQLSSDHTEGQRLLRLQLLTQAELANFPRRKALYRYVGMAADLAVDTVPVSNCPPGTVLLLCSDGLTDVLADPEICTVLGERGTLQSKAEMLLASALTRHPGHGDNITLMLIQL